MRLPVVDRIIPPIDRPTTNADVDAGVAVLVITRDGGLFSAIRDAVSAWKWTVRQQPDSFALAGHDLSGYPLVIYDGDSAQGNWKDALRRLRSAEGEPCVLLASRVRDQYLWNEVVRCGGFDVLSKNVGREHLTRTLRFAWFWKKNARGHSPNR